LVSFLLLLLCVLVAEHLVAFLLVLLCVLVACCGQRSSASCMCASEGVGAQDVGCAFGCASASSYTSAFRWCGGDVLGGAQVDAGTRGKGGVVLSGIPGFCVGRACAFAGAHCGAQC
jgi:hypothetical protein